IRNGRRPHRSDPAPANIDATPQEIEVTATRLATSGTLTRRSRAMSIGTGPRVGPRPAAVNIASDAAASKAQGNRPGRERRAATRSGALIGRSVVMPGIYSSDPDRWPVIGAIQGWRAGGSVLVSAH